MRQSRCWMGEEVALSVGPFHQFAARAASNEQRTFVQSNCSLQLKPGTWWTENAVPDVRVPVTLRDNRRTIFQASQRDGDQDQGDWGRRGSVGQGMPAVRHRFAGHRHRT
jgi:hypothetical protein